jgi:hypothetical protein
MIIAIIVAGNPTPIPTPNEILSLTLYPPAFPPPLLPLELDPEELSVLVDAGSD